MGYIYIHINKINGKVYIGQTRKNTPQERWGKGSQYKKCTLFYRAIQKYGWDNFDHEILCTTKYNDNLNWLEKMYIRLYHTTNPDFGYNITDGGSNGKGIKHSLESRKKQSETRKRLYKEGKLKIAYSFKKGNIPPNKGKKQSEWLTPEQCKKVRKNLLTSPRPECGFKKGHTPWNKGIRGITIVEDTLDDNKKYYFDSTKDASVFMGYASDKSMARIIRKHSLAMKRYYVYRKED